MPFRFAQPEWLALLVFLPFIAHWMGRAGRRAAIRFPATILVQSLGQTTRRSRGRWMWVLRLFTLTCLIVALARPQTGRGTQSIQASGIDITLAVDLSTSMWAHDFEIQGQATDRLTAVKRVVRAFVEARPNDRIGIVAFAGAPYLVSPLTLNHDWLLQSLDRLRIGIIEDGTAIGNALSSCINRLRAQPAKSRLVILLTDGSNNKGTIPPVAAAEAAAALKIKIYTIAAGREGIVPYPVFQSNNEPARDAWGQIVFQRGQSQVDTEVLQSIAKISGGSFFRAEDMKQLQTVYAEIDRLEKTDTTLHLSTLYDEAYFWPLGLGLACLALELALLLTRLRPIP